jgi:hypothetical protein
MSPCFPSWERANGVENSFPPTVCIDGRPFCVPPLPTFESCIHSLYQERGGFSIMFIASYHSDPGIFKTGANSVINGSNMAVSRGITPWLRQGNEIRATI